MEQHAAFAAQLANLVDRLEYARFIVGRHNCDQNGVIGERVFELIKINKTVCLDSQVSHAATVLLQMLAAIENGLVFRNGGNNVVALGGVSFRRAGHGQVVTVSSA